MNYLHEEAHQDLDEKTTYALLPLLAKVAAEAEYVSGEWNGDESGTLEDRAHLADEITETANKLAELIADLENEDY